MVPVKVGEQDIFIESSRPQTVEHAIAKLPQAAAPVQHDAPSLGLNFNARGLASEVHIRGLWCRDGTAHSPEGNVHRVLPGNPIQYSEVHADEIAKSEPR